MNPFNRIFNWLNFGRARATQRLIFLFLFVRLYSRRNKPIEDIQLKSLTENEVYEHNHNNTKI